MQAEEVTNWLSMCKSCNAMQLHHISSFKVQEIFMWLDLCRYRKKIEQVIDNLGWSKTNKGEYENMENQNATDFTSL